MLSVAIQKTTNTAMMQMQTRNYLIRMGMKNKRKLRRVLVESAEEGIHRIKSYKMPNKQQERKTEGKNSVDDGKKKFPLNF